MCIWCQEHSQEAVRLCLLCCSKNISCEKAYHDAPGKCCRSPNGEDTCCAYNSKCAPNGNCLDPDPPSNIDSSTETDSDNDGPSWTGLTLIIFFVACHVVYGIYKCINN
ncbi:unnamed protein product [Rotaria sordida]|uniref:Uncharacterized protein n=1 Tax=Rotaria sordida TaxID=392033 RepID=A0A813XHV1_9BILA|nr:unnamed protein product [Rotaria sordida]